jgi:hypothetical protein
VVIVTVKAVLFIWMQLNYEQSVANIVLYTWGNEGLAPIVSFQVTHHSIYCRSTLMNIKWVSKVYLSPGM